MEVPLFHTPEFILAVPALLCRGPTLIPNEAVKPLLPEHRYERSEERGRETGVEQTLDDHNTFVRPGPGRRGRIDIRVKGSIERVDEDLHVGGSQLVRVGS